MKRLFLLAVVAGLGVLLGFVAVPLLQRSASSTSVSVHADWASTARTIAEEASEADAVVRVAVIGRNPQRQIVDTLPEQARKPGMAETVIPFTDSRMQVLEEYKGSVDPIITVAQLGGRVLGSPEHPQIDYEVAEDPIFTVGSEYVLFLTETSVNGQGTYAILNPAGRYDVRDGQVMTYAQGLGDYTPPATLSELEAELQAATGGR